MGKDQYIYTELKTIDSPPDGGVINLYEIVISSRIRQSSSANDGLQYLLVELAKRASSTTNEDTVLLKMYPNDTKLSLPTAIPKYSILRCHRVGVFPTSLASFELRGKLGVRGCSLVIWRPGDPEASPSFSSSTNFTLTHDDLQTVKRMRKEVSIIKRSAQTAAVSGANDGNRLTNPLGGESSIRKLNAVRCMEYFDLFIEVVGLLDSTSGACVIRGWDGTPASNVTCIKVSEEEEEGVEILSMNKELRNRLWDSDHENFMVDIFCYGQFDAEARKLKAGDFVALFNCHSYLSKETFYRAGARRKNTCQFAMHSVNSEENRYRRAIKVLDPIAEESIKLASLLDELLETLPPPKAENEEQSASMAYTDENEEDEEDSVCSKSLKMTIVGPSKNQSDSVFDEENDRNESTAAVNLSFLKKNRQRSQRSSLTTSKSATSNDQPACTTSPAVLPDLVPADCPPSSGDQNCEIESRNVPENDEDDDLPFLQNIFFTANSDPSEKRLGCYHPTETWKSNEFIRKLNSASFGTRFKVHGGPPLRIINDKRYGIYPNRCYPGSSSRLFIFSCPKCHVVISSTDLLELVWKEKEVYCDSCKDEPLKLYFRFACHVQNDPNATDATKLTSILFHGPSAEKATGLTAHHVLHCWMNDLLDDQIWPILESLVGKTWVLTDGEVIPSEVSSSESSRKVCLVHRFRQLSEP